MHEDYVPSHLLTLATEMSVTFSFWTMIGVGLVTTMVWPWWRSFWGVNLISLDGSISLALFPAMLSIDFGINRFDNAWGAWIEIVSITLAGLIVLWRGLLVMITQMRGSEITPVQLWLSLLKTALRR